MVFVKATLSFLLCGHRAWSEVITSAGKDDCQITKRYSPIFLTLLRNIIW